MNQPRPVQASSVAVTDMAPGHRRGAHLLRPPSAKPQPGAVTHPSPPSAPRPPPQALRAQAMSPVSAQFHHICLAGMKEHQHLTRQETTPLEQPWMGTAHNDTRVMHLCPPSPPPITASTQQLLPYGVPAVFLTCSPPSTQVPIYGVGEAGGPRCPPPVSCTPAETEAAPILRAWAVGRRKHKRPSGRGSKHQPSLAH